MDGGVFINYRGADSRSYGALLYIDLARRLGAKRVFLDSESIPAGADFTGELLQRVRQARVLLAVIGPGWLTATDGEGRRRLDDPGDWIRRELIEAFAAGIRVIPVLVDGAAMPTEQELPLALTPLGRCQYRRLRHRDATSDLDRIAADLATIGLSLAAPAPQPRQPGTDYQNRFLEAADRLAEAVEDEWIRAANERKLLAPRPIPLRWSIPALPVGGPLREAVGSGPTRFAPLPGLAPITESVLRAGGGRAELHALYGGVATGRLLIVGSPGAGKTAAALLLVLDALAHRSQFAAERRRIPVPILLTLHRWDPRSRPLETWLLERLSTTYPMFRGRAGRALAGELMAAGLISLILDGLDEMADTLRPVALQALNEQARLRLVVLTRSAEMAQTARRRYLLGAAAVEISPIQGPVAADYLERALDGPPPAGWAELMKHLYGPDNSALPLALSTPLAITLLRDTYRSDDDLADLLTLAIHTTALQVEDHLLDRVLPTAYRPRLGEPPPRYNEAHALTTLGFIATRMLNDGVRSLAWWRLPRWTTAWPRLLLTVLAAIPTVGLPMGLAHGLIQAEYDGVPAGIRTGVSVGVQYGPTFGLAVGLAFVLMFGRSDRVPRRAGSLHLGAVFRREPLVLGALLGLIVAVAGSLFVMASPGSGAILDAGLQAGLPGGLGIALGAALTAALARSGADSDSPADPFTCWREDLTFARTAGLIYGVTCTFTCGAETWLADRGLNALPIGLAAGLTPAVMIYLCYPAASSTALTCIQLRLAAHTPIRLMRFLEDARARGVLRTEGPHYQFRHARLQDRLAANPINTRTAPRSRNRTPANPAQVPLP